MFWRICHVWGKDMDGKIFCHVQYISEISSCLFPLGAAWFLNPSILIRVNSNNILFNVLVILLFSIVFIIFYCFLLCYFLYFLLIVITSWHRYLGLKLSPHQYIWFNCKSPFANYRNDCCCFWSLRLGKWVLKVRCTVSASMSATATHRVHRGRILP